MRGWVSLLLVLVSPVPLWALGRVQFGAEFTFYSPAVGVMENSNPYERIPPGSDRIIERMRNHLIKNQPKGAKFIESEPNVDSHQSKGRFTSPNKWWFEWGHDDSVLEVITIPADVEFYQRYKVDMQDAIFASAANEGFFPATYLGGGHVNLGMTAFDGNELLLRNFVADLLFNHNELFLGVFNYDTHNGASIFVQTQRIRRIVMRIIDDFDHGGYRGDPKQFLRDIHSVMNLEGDVCFKKWKTGGSRQCYFGMNFSHHDEGTASRIELRGFRPQMSMDMWVRQIRLIKGRLLHLEKFNRPIPIRPLVKVAKLDLSPSVNHLLNPPVDPQEALAAFYLFVTEAGERWSDHRDYMWPQWINSNQLKIFEASRWFKKKERRTGDCERALEPDAAAAQL